MCNVLRQVGQWLCSPTAANSVADIYGNVMLDRNNIHIFGAAVQDFASRVYQRCSGTSDNYVMISRPVPTLPDWGEQVGSLGLEIVPDFQYKWILDAEITDIEPFDNGNHGVVVRAKYGDLDVIIKYPIHPKVTYNKVIEEAGIGVRMHDLGVGPRVIGLVESPHKRPGIMYEYIPGTITLARFKKNINQYSASQVVNVAATVAGHLSTMHKKGYVHKDITSRNVILIPDQQSESKFRVKLIDFGSAMYKTHFSRNTKHLPRRHPQVAPELESGMATTKMNDVFIYGLLIHTLSEASSNRAVKRTLSMLSRRCCMYYAESRPTMSATNILLLHRADLIQKAEREIQYLNYAD